MARAAPVHPAEDTSSSVYELVAMSPANNGRYYDASDLAEAGTLTAKWGPLSPPLHKDDKWSCVPSLERAALASYHHLRCRVVLCTADPDIPPRSPRERTAGKASMVLKSTSSFQNKIVPLSPL